MRRQREAVLAVGALLILSSLATAPPSYAWDDCAGDGQHKYTGRGFDPSYKVRGAQADIKAREGFNCGGPDANSVDRVSAWAMVAARDAAFRLGQIGYRKRRSQCGVGCYFIVQKFFYEYMNSTNGLDAVVVEFAPPDLGIFHEFRVTRWPSDGHLHFTYDGDPAPIGTAEAPFDPLNWANPVAKWMEESTDIGGDVPGSENFPTIFDFVVHKDGNEDWINQNWNFSAQSDGTNYCAYRTLEVTSNSLFYSFTDRSNC